MMHRNHDATTPNGPHGDEASGLTRRSLLVKSAALSGTALVGAATLPGAGRIAALSSALAAGKPGAVEAIPLTSDDLSLAPKRFYVDGQAKPLALSFVWGFMGSKDRKGAFQPPIFHIRTLTPSSAQAGVFSRAADGPLKFNKALQCGLVKGGTPIEYKTVQGDPEGRTKDAVTYEIKATAPDFLYRHSTKYTRVVEANVLDVTYTNMPYALVVNPPGGRAGATGGVISPYIGQLSRAKGTYRGRKVSYLSGNDRLFTGAIEAAFGPQLFIGIYFSGVHRDGRREYGFVAMLDDKGIAMYCRELGRGKTERVTSDDVTMKGVVWKPLEYNGKTPAFTKASWEFDGKRIDYQAKWGFSVGNACAGPPTNGSGFGLANSSGLWRERSSKNDFVESLVFAESHSNLEQVGLPPFVG